MQTSAIRYIYAILLYGLTICIGHSQTSITLSLINASANPDTVIQILNDGDTLDLGSLASTQLNIEATTSDPSAVGSIYFDLVNEQQQCEGNAPYALFGDSGGNFVEWTPQPGSYTLQVNAFSASCNTSTLIADTTINFVVINSSVIDCNGDPGGTAQIDDCGICAGGNTGLIPNADKDTCGVCFGNDSSCISGGSGLVQIILTLINADNNTPIKSLFDGDTIDLFSLVTNDLNVEATANQVQEYKVLSLI